MASKKLLVADDSLTIQKVIRLALSNEGYEIQAVSDGNDAVQQISLFRPDVILIDISLPTKSAFEVKRAINQQGEFSDLKFVLMSSAFESVDEDQAKEVVFDGRLTKPFDPAHLRQVLTDVLAKSQSRSGDFPTFPPAPPRDDEDGDDLDQPIQPAPDFPVFTPPGQALPEEEDEPQVWGKSAQPEEPFASLTPPPLPASKPAPAAPIAPPPNFPDFQMPEELQASQAPQAPRSAPEPEDSDVKHLTESTIRMSGLDDFQWSVNESARKPKSDLPPPPPSMEESSPFSSHRDEPVIRPFPGLSDLGGANFQIGQRDESQAIPPFRPEPSHEAPSTGANAYHNAPTQTGFQEEEEIQFQSPPPPPPGGASSGAMQVTAEQLEELVQREVQKSLEKLAREILPDVAERVIKQEIHRLLQEQI